MNLGVDHKRWVVLLVTIELLGPNATPLECLSL